MLQNYDVCLVTIGRSKILSPAVQIHAESFSVLGVDPTFNLGRFNVTVTTFRNLKVTDKVAGHHPIMIGPLLLSQTKTFDAYNYFFSKVSSCFPISRFWC